MAHKRPIPAREELEKLKRKELQSLAKQYKVAANKKSEVIIEELLKLREDRDDHRSQRSEARATPGKPAYEHPTPHTAIEPPAAPAPVQPQPEPQGHLLPHVPTNIDQALEATQIIYRGRQETHVSPSRQGSQHDVAPPTPAHARSSIASSPYLPPSRAVSHPGDPKPLLDEQLRADCFPPIEPHDEHEFAAANLEYPEAPDEELVKIIASIEFLEEENADISETIDQLERACYDIYAKAKTLRKFALQEKSMLIDHKKLLWKPDYISRMWPSSTAYTGIMRLDTLPDGTVEDVNLQESRGIIVDTTRHELISRGINPEDIYLGSDHERGAPLVHYRAPLRSAHYRNEGQASRGGVNTNPSHTNAPPTGPSGEDYLGPRGVKRFHGDDEDEEDAPYGRRVSKKPRYEQDHNSTTASRGLHSLPHRADKGKGKMRAFDPIPEEEILSPEEDEDEDEEEDGGVVHRLGVLVEREASSEQSEVPVAAYGPYDDLPSPPSPISPEERPLPPQALHPSRMVKMHPPPTYHPSLPGPRLSGGLNPAHINKAGPSGKDDFY